MKNVLAITTVLSVVVLVASPSFAKPRWDPPQRPGTVTHWLDICKNDLVGEAYDSVGQCVSQGATFEGWDWTTRYCASFDGDFTGTPFDNFGDCVNAIRIELAD
jgi:Tfp pilus assembly protein PilV